MKERSVHLLSGEFRLQAVLAGVSRLESNLIISLLKAKEAVSSLHA